MLPGKGDPGCAQGEKEKEKGFYLYRGKWFYIALREKRKTDHKQGLWRLRVGKMSLVARSRSRKKRGERNLPDARRGGTVCRLDGGDRGKG